MNDVTEKIVFFVLLKMARGFKNVCDYFDYFELGK